jgi:hypothetical protein
LEAPSDGSARISRESQLRFEQKRKPMHNRIAGAHGSPVKYGGGLERKRWLLAHEGVALKPASGRSAAGLI